ncbi:MAG: bifunctional precorrin-2 dehydrogenase/sirohydrochlorin ferrochelatase [Dehalococcoidia bacterium]|nr:bifunctional precorrin-2 dehydrogenase/sirohydrochlorin ferrochelatase [Dehalococcoidia bacterium]
MPRYYPAFIDVRERDCVVIGGGALGEEKVVKLLECDAKVIVISSEVTPLVQELASHGKIEWLRRNYRPGDLAQAFIAIASTDDDDMNRQIYTEAEERNVLLNVVDVTHLCTFIAPSVARRGEVTVATSTGGASPALARTFREKLESSRILEYADLAPILARGRAELRQRGLRVAPDHWQRCITEELLDTVQSGDEATAYQMLEEGLLAGAEPMSPL